MKKIPPLPKKKNILPSIQISAQQIKMPTRYRSAQKKQHLSIEQSQRLKKVQDFPEINQRINNFQRIQTIRLKSAGRVSTSNKSYHSNKSIQSKDSNASINKIYRASPNYNKSLRTTLPQISAQSWRFLCGKGNFKKREVASLTKIMNLITIMSIIERQNLIPHKIRLSVSKQVCTIEGTSAGLIPGAQVSLQDLLYGMMLPSGNDAAYLLALIGGSILFMKEQGSLILTDIYNSSSLTQLYQNTPQALKYFLQEMNSMSKKMNLLRSNWDSPHGLSNPNNYSTAQDMARLSFHILKSVRMREIVSTKIYSCKYYIQKQQQIVKQFFRWQNTNKLLWEGWSGIKTGITPNAGPCLSAAYTISINGKQYEFLIILINSLSMQIRWKQSRSLIEWIKMDPYYN